MRTGLLPLVMLLGCATAASVAQSKPAPEIPILIGAPGEPRDHFLARVVVAACTDPATPEDQVQHVAASLSACSKPVPSCLYDACDSLTRALSPPDWR